MKKREDDLPFDIHVIGDDGSGLSEAISKLLKAKFEGRASIEDMKRDAETCLDNHLSSVNDEVAQALTEKIWELCRTETTGNVLMALAQTVSNVIGERADPDEVRRTVAESPLTEEQKPKALEQGLHEAECWNCFNRSVSVRLGAFGLLLSKLGAAITGAQPDAPEHVKEMMRKVVDEVEGRDRRNPMH